MTYSSAVNNKTLYILILPYSTQEKDIDRELEEENKYSVSKLREFLRSGKQFHGATCMQQQENHKIKASENLQLDQSWCRFLKKMWSVHIRNAGPVKNVALQKSGQLDSDSETGTSDTFVQTCNVAQGPIVIRKDVFQKIGGLMDGFGKLSLLEFFLRSKGDLKIAKLGFCAWTPRITRADRGKLEGSNEVPEYTNFANKHAVLRIVTENRIEWTACVANWKMCPEKPYVEPRGLPDVAAPICCSAVLWKMLSDFVMGLNKLGLEYRIVDGTLLGAVRSKAIIPWTYDIDIALPTAVYKNASTYSTLEKVLENQYYAGMSFMNMPRGHILVPPYIDVNTAPYFDGPEDLEGKALFSRELEEAVKGMLPVSHRWRKRGYVDFYEAGHALMEGSSLVTINNEEFVTVKDVNKMLSFNYGENYLQPALKGEWSGLSDRNGS
ncbi:uncharacterized protein LOC111328596 [Stylophora pistillata]|uniref:uncharacterized protein LOC111328596 n=1 Tax=Stylophora pistillata TaxID=50429 RepID=UPI000C04D8F7|nr:uncharacterized protein LOC111328596 [Stylophora pistillata]